MLTSIVIKNIRTVPQYTAIQVQHMAELTYCFHIYNADDFVQGMVDTHLCQKRRHADIERVNFYKINVNILK